MSEREFTEATEAPPVKLGKEELASLAAVSAGVELE